MHTTNYFETFIEVSEDCPVDMAEVPSLKKGEKTIAFIHYDLIVNKPYQYTSDEVIFQVYVEKNHLDNDHLTAEWEKFFSKGQACLRASPLPKRYGWGIHSNREGKVAIYPRQSPEYQALCQDESLTHLKGMRSKRK